MKKIIILLLLVMTTKTAILAKDVYYNYKDQKITLSLNTQYIYLLTSISSKDELEKKFIGKAKVDDFRQDIYQQRLINKPK